MYIILNHKSYKEFMFLWKYFILNEKTTNLLTVMFEEKTDLNQMPTITEKI